MTYKPITRTWPSDRAILLVHGVGEAKRGSYADLIETLKGALGSAASNFAIYELYYNFINTWFSEKTALAEKLQQAKTHFRVGIGDPDLAEAIAEYAGDVLWPVLSRSARAAVREAYFAQLKQIVRDGITAGHDAANQRITIIAHSLGCFYTYEVLHAAADKPSHRLTPYTDSVRFANVIMMASPVQLIRTIAEGMGPALPNRNELATVAAPLGIPAERRGARQIKSTNNWISITGELDPIGGFFYRKRAPWAYMQVEGQTSIVDPQTLLDINSKADLIEKLTDALSEREVPDIDIGNPHSWEGYVARHERELMRWLVV